TLVAVGFITYLADRVSMTWLPLAAIAGAGVMSLLMYVLAWKKGVTPLRLVLVGIGMSAATSSLTMMMIVLGNHYSTQQAYIWLTGSVYGANWGDVLALLPWVVVCIPLALLFARTANVQELGDDV